MSDKAVPQIRAPRPLGFAADQSSTDVKLFGCVWTRHNDRPLRVIAATRCTGNRVRGMATVHSGACSARGFSRTSRSSACILSSRRTGVRGLFLDEARLAGPDPAPQRGRHGGRGRHEEELFSSWTTSAASRSRDDARSRKREIDVSLGVVASIIAGIARAARAPRRGRTRRARSVLHRGRLPQNVLVASTASRASLTSASQAAARIDHARRPDEGQALYWRRAAAGKVVDRRTDIFAVNRAVGGAGPVAVFDAKRRRRCCA